MGHPLLPCVVARANLDPQRSLRLVLQELETLACRLKPFAREHRKRCHVCTPGLTRVVGRHCRQSRSVPEIVHRQREALDESRAQRA